MSHSQSISLQDVYIIVEEEIRSVKPLLGYDRSKKEEIEKRRRKDQDLKLSATDGCEESRKYILNWIYEILGSVKDKVTPSNVVKITGVLTADGYLELKNKLNKYARFEDANIKMMKGVYNNGTLFGMTPYMLGTQLNKADFEILLTKVQIKGLQEHRYTLAAKGQAVFLDKSKSIEKSANGYVQFVINDEPVPPPPSDSSSPPEPGIPPVVFQPKPQIPDFAFDIVDFNVSDNTDMSMVESREVFIDGVQVDDKTFFNGEYVFGDGSQGLKQVVVNYTSTDDQKAQVIKWVLVYCTKPRAQYKLDGTYKQNRKLTLTNTSLIANDSKVLEYYPITSWQWEYNAVSGNQASMKMRGSNDDLFKEFLYKEPGTYSITLQAVNSPGRISDPYTVQFVIAPDVPPAIEICMDNSVLARNENISAYHYLVSSTDGDIIKSNIIELWYDSDNNGTFDQLINTWNGAGGFPAFAPTKLGKYKYINRASEDFGQDNS